MSEPAPPPPVPSARGALRRVAVILLVCAVVASVAVALAGQVAGLPDVELRFRPAWFVGATLALFLFAASHIELWRFMLRELGAPIAPWPARSVFNASLLARYVPTGLLSFVVRINLAEREGVPKRTCFTTLVYEIGLSVAAALLVAAWFVADLPALAGEPVRYVVVPLAAALVAGLHPRIFVPIVDRLLRRIGRDPLSAVLPFSAVLRYTGSYVLGFVAAGVGVWCFAAMITPVAPGDVPVIVASYSIGFVVGLLGILLPGGLGAREGGLALALAPALGASIAIAVAVGVRVVQIGLELTYAALSAVLARRGRPAARAANAAA